MANRMTFDDEATRVITEAHRLAVRLGHATTDVPHLLWAIVTKGSGRSERALRTMGRDADELARAVEAGLPPPDPDFGGWRTRSDGDGTVRVTSGFKAVVDAATGGANGNDAPVDEVALLDSLVRARDPQVVELLERVGLGPRAEPEHGGADELEAHDPGDSKLLELVGQYGRIVTEEARQGRLDPVIGRDAELRRVGYILGRRRKNNPVLLGDPGVGKTAIVEGLAQAIVAGDVPSAIAGRHIFALDVGSLVAGTKYRGEFEERVQLLLDWLAEGRESIILFIDELHLLAGAGGAEGAIDAASFFKPQLARGELRAIGATTAAEYRKYIVHDGALERRFQPVFVSEPSVEETYEMLRGLRPRYEGFHGASISDAALRAAVRTSVRRLPERRLPDKAIDLIDEAASRSRARSEPRGDLQQSGARPRIEVTPEDVHSVVEEWAAGGSGGGVKQQAYSTGAGRRARERLATIGRRIRR